MKFPWTIFVVAILLVAAQTANATPYPNNETPARTLRLTDEMIRTRVAQLDLPFDVRSSSLIHSAIRRYVVEGQRDSEYILGRSGMYFPVFEHYLRVYGLPESLKYLPIIESSLRPGVKSPMGAAGLWQFIPSTGRLYGLTVNGQLDERLDSHKATEAAVQMLASLYAQFKDWGLVLAAYNCGPGRVRQAMREANSSNFWKVKDYLPAESQHYLPRFVAAAYLVNYYDAHGLQPEYPSQEFMNTRTFRVHQSLHLSAVARQLGVGYKTLTYLNPSYLQGLVPASETGHFVTVPDRVAMAFATNFLQIKGSVDLSSRQASQYVTVPGDNLDTLAILFQCTPEDIMAWNGLRERQLTVNQTLVVYLQRSSIRP